MKNYKSNKSLIILFAILLSLFVIAFLLKSYRLIPYFEEKNKLKSKTEISVNNKNDFNKKKEEERLIKNTISPNDFKQKIESKEYTLIDVRSPEEYKKEHLKGAININYYSNNFQNQIKKLDKNKKYLIYCYSGNQSAQSIILMQKIGIKKIYELKGGIKAWKDNNFPTVTNQNSGEKNKLKTISWYKPKPGITWQWQLDGPINTSYNVNLYDIDLFDTPQNIINKLHSQKRKVICYFSAGTWEKWRPDAKKFSSSVIGHKLEDWEEEKWLNISQYQKFSPIIQARMDLAVKKNCDGIEPDNIDGYENKTGFKITFQDQLKYNRWLSNEAHKRGLAIALKNDLNQIPQLINYFDFAINEQCFQYHECEPLKAFIRQNKAVLGVEYELKKKKFCSKANNLHFSWLKMNYDLKGKRSSCN